MKIQFASDLHLEFYDAVPRNEEFFALLVTPKDADILILAGDIGYPESEILFQFLEWCSTQWKHVLWIYGNHEYYNKKPYPKWKYCKHFTMLEKEQIGKEYSTKISNLHVLHNETLTLPEFPDYMFIGTTLWTDVEPEEEYDLANGMADFHYIAQAPNTRFSVNEWTARHLDAVELLENTLTSSKKRIVITHHLPTYDMILDKYKTSTCNFGFAAHCDEFLQHVCVWICGHSHGSKKHPVYPCYLNARGYPREESQLEYNPTHIIEL